MAISATRMRQKSSGRFGTVKRETTRAFHGTIPHGRCPCRMQAASVKTIGRMHWVSQLARLVLRCTHEQVRVRPHHPSNSDAAVDAHLRDLIAANEQELPGTRSSGSGASSSSGPVKITRRGMAFWGRQTDEVLRTQIALRGVSQSTFAHWSREECLITSPQ